jgi:hypothetical protein
MFVYCMILSAFFQFFQSAAIVALCNAAIYGLLSRLDRLWKWPILLAMAGGPLILARPGVNPLKQPMPCIFLLGALWTIGGAITFSLYLHHSRRVSE